MDIKWIALFVLGPLIAVLVIATVAKYVEVWRARSWRLAPGKITSARAVARSHAISGPGRTATYEVRNFADVKYVFKVGDVTHKGSRMSIGEDAGNADVAQKLARYPVGARVTVYYNPKDPSENVLERDPPPGLFQAMGWFIALLIAIGVLAGTGIEWFEKLIREHISNPRATPLVVILLLMSGFVALIARALRIEADKTSSWLETTGQVAKAANTSASDASAHRFAYVYTVDGIEYVGDQAALSGTTVMKINGVVVDHRARKYPPGTFVRVFYDPENPSRAVLETGSRGVWFVRAMAIALAAIALFFATRAGG